MDKVYFGLVCFGIFVVVWMLAGIIGAWRYHQGHLKERYVLFDLEDKKYSREEKTTIFFFHLLSSFGGFFILWLYETSGKYNCWYYKRSIKNNKNSLKTN